MNARTRVSAALTLRVSSPARATSARRAAFKTVLSLQELTTKP